MKLQTRKLFSNITYTVSANFVSMIISVLLVMFLPKLLGKSEYGYLQLYMLYISYVGFFHFGWIDGIYLRYGGSNYSELDKGLFKTQFQLLVCLEIILSIGIFILALLFVDDRNKVMIFSMAALNCILLIPRAFFQLILQATNRIKEYARNILVERILYCIFVIAVFVFGVREFKYVLVCDIFAKLIATVSIFWLCRDILFFKAFMPVRALTEARENIRVGCKLMFANIAGLLIVGVVRLSIEKVWSVETFGKVSLSFTVSNLVMVFITAISIVLFPVLKRIEPEKWSIHYNSLRSLLMPIILVLLTIYYPARLILSAWLPQYADSLRYMALLFPICLYEAKASLLNNTFLKATRRETTIFVINGLSVLLSAAASIVFVFILKDLNMAVFSILVLLMFRSILGDFLLAKQLHILVIKDVCLEFIMTAVFLVSNWFVGGWIGFFAYFIVLVVYMLIYRKAIISSLRKI